MKNFKVLLPAVVLSVVTAAPNAISADYRKIVECEGGALVIDIDQDQPKRGQVVIHDQRIIDYLIQKNFITSIDERTAEINRMPRSLILRGDQDSRLSAGFKGFEVYPLLNEGSRYSSHRFGPFQRHQFQFFVYPEANGIKLRIDEHLNSFSGCAGQVEFNGSVGSICRSQYVSYPSEHLMDRGNWFFQGCRKI